MPHPGASALLLRVGDLEKLTAITRSGSVRASLAQRARIALLAADGVANTEIAVSGDKFAAIDAPSGTLGVGKAHAIETQVPARPTDSHRHARDLHWTGRPWTDGRRRVSHPIGPARVHTEGVTT